MTKGRPPVPSIDQRSLPQAVLGDGRPLLSLTALCLILAGVFAIFQSATGHFLPHDEAWLGMTARQLCDIEQCRIVHFMIHDRIAFGGVIIVVGAIYLWLTHFPLADGRTWAWWLLLLSSVEGFGSFLLYIGHGYLDTWHGAATLFLLPCFVIGLWRARPTPLRPASWRTLLLPAAPVDWSSRAGRGRNLLAGVGITLFLGGTTIMTVGVTSVFVPSDLVFLGLSYAEVAAVSDRLVPLIAHDRAGFGGGVACCGILIFGLAWWAPPSRHLWQILAFSLAVGFGCAIGVHPAIGYNDALHLLPAVGGAVVMAVALWLLAPTMLRPDAGASCPPTTTIIIAPSAAAASPNA